MSIYFKKSVGNVKTETIAKFNASINANKMYVEVLNICKDVLKNFDGKVLNKKITDAVMEVLKEKYSHGVHFSITDHWDGTKKFSLWFSCNGIECARYQVESFYGGKNWVEVDFSKVAPWNEFQDIIRKNDEDKSPRFSYASFEKTANERISAANNNIENYRDAIENFDEYEQMAYELALVISNYQETCNKFMVKDVGSLVSKIHVY